MELHRNKSLSYGFVILSPDRDIGRIKTTLNSIKRNDIEDAPCVCACAKETTPAEIKEIKAECPNTHRGQTTITSLINKGMQKGHKEWNLIVVEGTVIRRGVMQRFARFVESEKDVLFPIVMDHDREGNVSAAHTSFVDSSINGLLMHFATFKKVGPFGNNDLTIERTLWATTAREHGCQFKAILGTKLL